MKTKLWSSAIYLAFLLSPAVLRTGQKLIHKEKWDALSWEAVELVKGWMVRDGCPPSLFTMGCIGALLLQGGRPRPSLHVSIHGDVCT